MFCYSSVWGGVTSCSGDDDDDSSSSVSLTQKIANEKGDVDLGNKTYNENASIDKENVTVSNATFSGNTITVNKTGVTLKNLKNLNVVAAEGIGDGDLNLVDCEINELTVLGGGENSIHISSTTIKIELKVNKEKVRIAFKNAVEVALLSVFKNDVNIEGTNGTKIESMSVESSVESVSIGGGTVEKLTVDTSKTTVTVTEVITITETTATTISVADYIADEVKDTLPATVTQKTVEDPSKFKCTVAELAGKLKTAKDAGKTNIKAKVTDATVDNIDVITQALAPYGTEAAGYVYNKPDIFVDLDLTKSTGLTEIPESAFRSEKNVEDSWKTATLALSSIELPVSVEFIGHAAFNCCHCLTSITLNEGLKTIGDWAFGAMGLEYISIPSTVESIGPNAFYFRWTEPKVDFKSKNLVLKDGLVLSKDGSEVVTCFVNGDITIPDTVTKICDGAFKGMGALTSITLPSHQDKNWCILKSSDVDVSKLTPKEIALRLTAATVSTDEGFIENEEYKETTASSDWVIATSSALPYSVSGTVPKNTMLRTIGMKEEKGISFSFFIENDYTNDWTMIFATETGNIGLTCLHYCKDFSWNGNFWPTNYPSDNSPARSYDVYLKNKCYVTVSVSQTGMTFYKNGRKMFNYDDTNGGFAGYAPEGTELPTMATYCAGVLKAIAESCVYICPTTSWLSNNVDYTMTDLYISTAMTAEEALAQCQKAGGTVDEELPIPESQPVDDWIDAKTVTLTGTEWWSGAQSSEITSLAAGPATVTYTFKVASDGADCLVEAYDSSNEENPFFLSTTSQKTAWTANPADKLTNAGKQELGFLKAGIIYTAIVSYDGNKVTITYIDKGTDGAGNTEMFTTETTGTIVAPVNVHFAAEFGTFYLKTDVSDSGSAS